MTDTAQGDKTGAAVPSRRLARVGRFGRLGAGVAGSVIAGGTRQALKGEKPVLNDLLLTPTNAARVADELSQLRGAAMKMGQLLSMDAGDLVPPELSAILGRLRSSAHSMPPKQLRRVLDQAWGPGWLRRFERFDLQPVAAASIDQVHRARLPGGTDLAIKVQYPGVRESINSDVDNVALLVKMTGLLPKDVDIAPLLAEGKAQLKEEADYEREAACMARFGALLEGDDRFVLPAPHEELTTPDVLAMTYLRGEPIDTLSDAPQDRRDAVVGALMDLLLSELFTFRFMQTDPNFANYFVREDGTLALLDFGASREVPKRLSDGYKALLRAGMTNDMEAVHAAAVHLGIAGEDLSEEHGAVMTELFGHVMEPMRADGPFDFGASDLGARIRDQGMALRTGGFHHVPPPVTMFLHRKIVGVYLMATNLRARVDVGALLRPHLA